MWRIFTLAGEYYNPVCSSWNNKKKKTKKNNLQLVLLILQMFISHNSNIPALEEMQALLYHSENALLIGCLNKKLITVDLAFGNIAGEVPILWMHGVS